MDPSIGSDARKGLVTLAIEGALLNIGKEALDKVIERLQKDYHCDIPDCYENPEYLKHILKDLYGNCYEQIVSNIEKKLEGFTEQNLIKEFLTVMST